jgi:hypothetical protein
MAIFDEPSRKPLPKTPDLDEVRYVALKGVASLIPAGSELFGLLTSPLARRRDDWMEDLERRLRDLERSVEGFRFEDLGQNEQFVSATLVATQAALKTHQTEKLEALRNAVMNVALAKGPTEDLQLMFLNFVDSFPPSHLRLLSYLDDRSSAPKPGVQDGLRNQVLQDLNNQGFLKDSRPFVARNRDYTDLLSSGSWTVNSLGKQFLDFIKAPKTGNE